MTVLLTLALCFIVLAIIFLLSGEPRVSYICSSLAVFLSAMTYVLNDILKHT